MSHLAVAKRHEPLVANRLVVAFGRRDQRYQVYFDKE